MKNQTFIEACEQLQIKPMLSKKRLITLGYLRQTNYGPVSTPKSSGLFYTKDTGFTPKDTGIEIRRNQVWVTATGFTLLPQLCGDLAKLETTTA